MNLGVVIPTFERLTNLHKILHRIVEWGDIDIPVTILVDPNDPCLESYTEIISFKKRLNINLVINKYPLGTDGSILRSLELVDADWIYFLGDSKLPTKSALALMKDHISTHADIVAVIYSWESSIGRQKNVSTIHDLCKSGINLGDLILGGNTLVSKRILKKHLPLAYRTLSSRIAHVAPIIMALSKNESVLISQEKIIEKFLEKPSFYNPGKSLIDCWYSFNLLNIIDLPLAEARTLNSFILKNENWSSRINFIKFCLLCMFRSNIKIYSDLKKVMKFRYMFSKNYAEIFALKVLIFVAFFHEKLR